MLESRSYYHPLGERGSEPYKWCVKFVVCGCDRGLIGCGTKAEAQKWLDWALDAHKNGTYFSDYLLLDHGVYYTGKRGVA
jgi:hypothetical protein